MTLLELNRNLDEIQAIINKIRTQFNQTPRHNGKIRQNVKLITNTVENQYKIPRGSVYTDSRKGPISEARQMSMFLIFHITKTTVGQTGYPFGRDISNVSYSMRTIKNLIQTISDVSYNFMKVCNTLKLEKNFINEMLK